MKILKSAKKIGSAIFGMGALLALTNPAMSQSGNLTEIKVSYQPALYWALPFFVATEFNWWQEVGLKPVFSTFPAGVPQIAAAESKSWDVGGTGSVPAVLGHIRFGIKTIGITNDESQANALVGSGAMADKIAKDHKAIAGQLITLTSNSTGDYAVQACLKKWGFAKTDVVMKNMGQAEAISALSSNNSELAGLWAPNTYTVEEKAGAKTICTGKDVGAIVPGALIARGDYAKENPQNVAKFLAVYLRGWNWAKSNPAEAVKMLEKFYAQGGVVISEASLKKEFATRPTFNLAEQLKILDRSKGVSDVDKWLGDIGAFIQSVGTIPENPKAADYITDDYMKLVNSDAKLKEFANKTSK